MGHEAEGLIDHGLKHLKLQVDLSQVFIYFLITMESLLQRQSPEINNVFKVHFV